MKNLTQTEIAAWLTRHGMVGTPEEVIPVQSELFDWEGLDGTTTEGIMEGRLFIDRSKLVWDRFVPADGSEPFDPGDLADTDTLDGVVPDLR